MQQAATSIRRSIVLIGGKSGNSGLQTLLGAYLKLISPAAAASGEANFPQPVKQHPTDHDRCQTSKPRRGTLICFHVGNALLAYYDLVRGEDHEHLRARVKLLEEIAELGPGAFHPYGTPTTGYMLATERAADAAHAARQDHDEEAHERVHPTTQEED